MSRSPVPVPFADVCDTIEQALAGPFREDVVRELSTSPTVEASLVRLRAALRTDVWAFGDAGLDLARPVRDFDQRTRAEGFHALHD